MTRRGSMSLILTAISLALASASYSGKTAYVLVFLNSNPKRAVLPEHQLDSLQSAHMANINRLAKEGKLIAAGPFEGGGGIFVLQTADLSEARSWVESDPAVQANRFIVELFSYAPRTGSFCRVEGKITMVSYHFVRYAPSDTASPSALAKAWADHRAQVERISSADSVLSEGTLDGDKGAILIVKGKFDESFVREDPAVRQGYLAAAIKEIWIARGALCEQ
ncbi:MAG TPA: YciI family protein [Bacteroidota bacterium]|nr:YciI family protein [Bacteroidota bacterium]